MVRDWQVNRGAGGPWRWPEVSAIADSSAAATGASLEPIRGTVAFWATVAFTFIAFTAPQYSFPVLGTLRIALVTAGVAMGACLVDRLVRQQPLTVVTREMGLAATLAGWAILTVPLSYWPGGSVSFLLGLYFKSLALFWLLSNTVNTRARLRRLVWAISLTALPMAGTAIANFLSAYFLPGLAYTPKRIVGYDAPLTANPNDLALMLNLIMPLSVALLLTARRPVLRLLLVAVILLNVVAVIVTFSRGGFVTLTAVIAIYMWKLRWRPERRWVWAALVLAVACTPLFPSGYLARLATITDIASDVTGSAQLRWNDTFSAINFVLANPIVGAGVGMNTLALYRETGWRTIHNVYLEYAVELGLPGLMLFLLLLVACIKSVVLVQQRSADVPGFRDFFYLAEGIQISLLAFSVAALFSPVGYHLYFYYVAGLAIAIKSLWAEEESKLARLTPRSPQRDGQPGRDRPHMSSKVRAAAVATRLGPSVPLP